MLFIHGSSFLFKPICDFTLLICLYITGLTVLYSFKTAAVLSYFNAMLEHVKIYQPR